MVNKFNRQNCPSGSIPYTIREGDTLSSIAKQYNTTVPLIRKANPRIIPDVISVGEQICIPLQVQLYPSCPTTNYYVVTKDDTFLSIANYFNVTTEELYYKNFGIDPTGLYEDQLLCIPIESLPLEVIVNVKAQQLVLLRNRVIQKIYPIAKENPSAPIPRGSYVVLNKQVDPGVEQGARWLGLSEAGLGIHGTNTPQFIELVSSEKSIIMTNEDISELFNLVPVGTKVTIV